MNLSAQGNPAPLSWIDLLKEQVDSLRYGVVQIVVHDRNVVQIEKTEKFRFDKPDAKEGAKDSKRL